VTIQHEQHNTETHRNGGDRPATSFRIFPPNTVRMGRWVLSNRPLEGCAATLGTCWMPSIHWEWNKSCSFVTKCPALSEAKIWSTGVCPDLIRRYMSARRLTIEHYDTRRGYRNVFRSVYSFKVCFSYLKEGKCRLYPRKNFYSDQHINLYSVRPVCLSEDVQPRELPSL
jgi:hypothetical protein